LRAWLPVVFVAMTLAPVLVFSGCQKSAPVETKIVGRESQSPAELLRQLVATYRVATSYQDIGELHLMVQSTDGLKDESQPIPFSVAFERPNKIRVHAVEANVLADGRQMHASANSLRNQVLAQACPQRLNREILFADPMLAEASRGQLEAVMPQLALLLDDDPLTTLSAGGTATILNEAEFDGKKCQRVAVAGAEGRCVFWIGTDDGTLHKFEFASDALAKKFEVARCSLWVEFKAARLNQPIAERAFVFAVPEGAKLLKRFLPPPPDSPPPLLAKVPDDFTFVDLNGAPVGRDTFKGRIVVLDMWATWCGWCFRGLPNLEQVYQKYKNNDKVLIVAVNTDEPAVSDARVRESFDSARLTIPIVRDASRLVNKVFQVQVVPTLVVLGADGTVQVYQVGYDEQLAETLPKKLDLLLAGEDVAGPQLEAYRRTQQEYDRRVTESLADSPIDTELTLPEIARKKAATQ
jgi:thiol-disulfide isomerase/thioredoxin